MNILSRFLAPFSHPFRADNWKHSGVGLSRKFYSPSISHLNLEALVVSPGGVGTTFFMEHLSKYLVTNCPGDSDGLKHAPRPTNFAPDLRIIYLDGSINEVVASLERRRFDRKQAGKLGLVAASLLPRTLSRPLLKRAIEAQQRVWLERLPKKQVLHLHYDDIWDRLRDVEAHLGLEGTDFLATFPAKRPRLSKIEQKSVIR